MTHITNLCKKEDIYINVKKKNYSFSCFLRNITNPSITGVRHLYSSVASSALSPTANSTGVVWVCTPAIVLGVPAFPMTSTAYKVQ